MLKDQGTACWSGARWPAVCSPANFRARTRSPRIPAAPPSTFPIVDKERAWRILDVLRPIGKAHDTGVATIALAWVLAKPFVTSVIIGAKRPNSSRRIWPPSTFSSRQRR